MLSKSKTVPPYNRYDPKIWLIKQNVSYWAISEERINRALTQKPRWSSVPPTKIGKGVVFDCEEYFVYAVNQAFRNGRITKYKGKPTVWKIMCPDLEEPREGSTYYIVETRKNSLVFKGTYGYLGSGSIASAFVERCLEKLKLHFEVRDGDYLLNFF